MTLQGMLQEEANEKDQNQRNHSRIIKQAKSDAGKSAKRDVERRVRDYIGTEAIREQIVYVLEVLPGIPPHSSDHESNR